MSDFPLEAKRALVTGASSGIGRAIALGIGKAGGELALVARREARLQEVADKLKGEAHVVVADLSSMEEVRGAVEAASKAMDGIDIVVNAAGVGLLSRVSDGDPKDWEQMLRINVMALGLVTREALPHMPRAGGHVVNIGSMSGHRVPPTGGFYAATKHAVRAQTEALRAELRADGNPTRVTHVSPGFVDTPLADGYLEAVGMAVSDLGYEALKPEDVADPLVAALSAPAGVEINDIQLRPTGQGI